MSKNSVSACRSSLVFAMLMLLAGVAAARTVECTNGVCEEQELECEYISPDQILCS